MSRADPYINVVGVFLAPAIVWVQRHPNEAVGLAAILLGLVALAVECTS